MSVSISIGVGLESGSATPHSQSIGKLTGGPINLLQWLESQLGLEVPAVSFTERTLQYLACLKQRDSISRFYHRSLQLDELGVAKRLLQWRDTWYEAGWQGQPFPTSNQRLSDMAEVEGVAAVSVSLNVGQRVQRVISILSDSPVDVDVYSFDAVDSYPAVWRSLLLALNVERIHVNDQVLGSGDLATLQKLLVADKLPSSPVALAGDGSLAIMKAPSKAISARWLAQYCQQLSEDLDDYQIGLLCESGGESLDLAFEHAGAAQLALGGRSSWRPVFQVLPLVMELLWSPLNPHRLLQFLSHPVGPISRRVRQRLAEVVAREPGIDGENWQHEIGSLLEQEVSRSDDPEKGRKAAEKLQASITYWLESERFQPDAGAPITKVMERARALIDWLSGYVTLLEADENNAEMALYYSAKNQVRELIGALEQLVFQGSETIDANTLRRLVKAVRGDGGKRPDKTAGIIEGQSKLCVAITPAAFLGSTPVVLWWGVDKPSSPKAYDWTQKEIALLRNGGVLLQTPDAQIDWDAATWQRPILAAEQQLILMVHEDSDGHHPVFDLIKSLVSDIPEFDVLSMMQSAQNLKLKVSTPVAPQALDVVTLPVKQRCWQLPENTVMPKRERESFSSLESFIFGPYMWVLRYQAKLKAGTLLSVSDNNLLKGSLAHELYEAFFNTHPDIGSIDLGAAKSWALDSLRRLIDSSGAVMNLPGRAAERERFIQVTLDGLLSLISHLQAADVVSVLMESHATGLFSGGALGGYLDMLVVKSDGTEAVIDIKWGGFKYRRESMQDSRYLQLAIYAELRRQQSRSFPTVGYFIIDGQELLVLNSHYFPEAEKVEAKNGENIAEFWQRFESSWKQRREQLDSGTIEVNVSGTDVMEALLMDETGLENLDTFESFSEFGMLVGWEAES